MPGTLRCDLMKAVMRFRNSMCSSFHSPKSCGEMRPSASTAVASVNTSAAPPHARLPKCTRCQSLANPSRLEYMHIGETTMRCFSVNPRNVRDSNKCAITSAAHPSGQPHTGKKNHQLEIDMAMRITHCHICLLMLSADYRPGCS